jgi:hypothetical protein
MQLKACTSRAAGPKRARAATVAKATSDAAPPPAWPQRCVPPEVKHRDTPKVTIATRLTASLPAPAREAPPRAAFYRHETPACKRPGCGAARPRRYDRLAPAIDCRPPRPPSARPGRCRAAGSAAARGAPHRAATDHTPSGQRGGAGP